MLGPGVVGDLVEEFVEHREARRRVSAALRRASWSLGPSSLTTGRISRANGRISFLMIGVVFSASLRVASLAGPSARANGSELLQRRARARAWRSRACRGRRRSCAAPPGSSSSVFWKFASSLANVANTALEASTSCESCWSLPPSASISSAEVVDRARDVRVADFELLGDLFGVARRRVEALEVGRQRPAVVLQPDAQAGEQLLQVGARFARRARRGIRRSRCSRAVCDSGSTSPLCSLPAEGCRG